MAIGDILGPFIWGEGGQKLSPEEVARQRALASRLASQVGDTSPVGHWTQGLTRVTEALRGNLTDWRANQAEQAGLAEAQSAISPIIAALGGGASVPSSYGQSQTVSAPQTARAPNLSSEPISGDGWLRYANSGATRNQQLAPELVNALGFLPELGVEMEVFSGGQPSAGNGARVGSDRHDHGNAADAFFYKDDRRLDWSNPNDLPLFEEIVRRGKSAGITGFGAGDGYMQPGSMHIGFGSNAVWGAGGKGANAPEWLRRAYTSPTQENLSQPRIGRDALEAIEQAFPQEAQAFAASSPRVQQQAAQVIQSNPEQAGSLLASILQAQANPWAQKQYGSVLNTLMTNELNQRNQANDPLRQLQIQQAQLQLDQARNPYQATPASPEQLAQWGIDPNAQGWTIGPDGIPQQVYAPQQPKLVFEGGQWWDTSTGMPAALTEPVQSNPANVMEYKFYADQAQELGQQPLPYGEWDLARRQSGATQVNVGGEGQRMGTIPAGMAAVPDPTNPSGFRMEAIPGGPAAQQAEAEAAQAIKASEQASRYGNVVLEDIDRAVSAIETDPLLTTGVVGQWMSGVGGTPANRVGNLLSTIKANAGFDRLQAMRDASPTGGALGSVSEMELSLLNSAIGSLEQSNNSDDLVYNLRRVQNIYNEIINGAPQSTNNTFDNVFGAIQQSNPSQSMGVEPTMLETLVVPPPPVGTIEDGWVYIGGDPAQQQSWQRAR